MISFSGQVELPTRIKLSSSIPLKWPRIQAHKVELWTRPFLLKVVRRQKAPVAKRLLLQDAKLVWHSNLFKVASKYLGLKVIGHLTGRHSTSQDRTSPYKTIQMQRDSTTELILPFYIAASLNKE